MVYRTPETLRWAHFKGGVLIRNLKFKKRTCTNWLYIIKKPLNGASKDELVNAARRLGEFDTGYHYIIQNDGTLEKDRERADSREMGLYGKHNIHLRPLRHHRKTRTPSASPLAACFIASLKLIHTSKP